MIPNLTFAQWIVAIAGFFVPTASFVFTLFKFLHANVEKRAEQRKRESAEAELHAARRRAQAPFLVASGMWAERWGRDDSGSQHTLINGNSFSPTDHPPNGAIVTLAAQNQGQTVRAVELSENVHLTLDAPGREIREQAPGRRATLFTYRFDVQQLGRPMRFVLSFESQDGFQQKHSYELIHGACQLHRIEPR